MPPLRGVTMPLPRIVLPLVLLSAGAAGAPDVGRTRSALSKVDPTSIQITSTMDSIPAIGVPNVVKVGSTFSLACKWDVKFLKAMTLHDPIPLDVRITDTFNGITVLKSAPSSVKAGDYKNPGMQAVGGIVATWKPEGLGNHELTCQAGITAQEWWGPTTLPIAQKKWTILVDPETYKTCLPLYLASVAKSPKMSPGDGAGPVELLLSLDSAQGIGDQMICHYRSKSGDLPDFPVTLPCPGAKLLPPIPGKISPPRFYCKP